MGRLGTMLQNKIVRAVLVVVGLVAALSVGGAFFVGVVIAPLLVVVAREASPWGSWGYGVIAATLATEMAWGLTYLLAGEQQPAIWLVPAVAGVATLAAAVMATERKADVTHAS